MNGQNETETHSGPIYFICFCFVHFSDSSHFDSSETSNEWCEFGTFFRIILSILLFLSFFLCLCVSLVLFNFLLFRIPTLWVNNLSYCSHQTNASIFHSLNLLSKTKKLNKYILLIDCTWAAHYVHKMAILNIAHEQMIKQFYEASVISAAPITVEGYQ